jgi:hypothetical protein
VNNEKLFKAMYKFIDVGLTALEKKYLELEDSNKKEIPEIDKKYLKSGICYTSIQPLSEKNLDKHIEFLDEIRKENEKAIEAGILNPISERVM